MTETRQLVYRTVLYYKQSPPLQAHVNRREWKDCGIHGLVPDSCKTERLMKFMSSLTQDPFDTFETSSRERGYF